MERGFFNEWRAQIKIAPGAIAWKDGRVIIAASRTSFFCTHVRSIREFLC